MCCKWFLSISHYEVDGGGGVCTLLQYGGSSH